MSNESNYQEILEFEYQERLDHWIGLFGSRNWLERSINQLSSNNFHTNNRIDHQEDDRTLILLGQQDHKAQLSEVHPGIICIFEGVLYNFHELVQTLNIESVPDISNAALISKLFNKYGDQAFTLIKGVYIFILLDTTQKVLYAGRDRMGSYPLFFSTIKDLFLFSTSVEALLAHPDVSKEVNRAAIADHLCNRWPVMHETFLADVYRIPAGNFLISSENSRLHFQRYWDPIPSGEDVNWVKKSEIDQFDFLLNQAVERAINLGKPGIFLSGGLDSITVATIAADLQQKSQLDPLLALSMIFPTPDANEEVLQRKVAEDLKIPQIFVNLEDTYGSNGLVISSLIISNLRGLPVQNIWITGYQALSLQGKKAGCEMILTGTGGDEWLSVSPYYAADLMKNLDFIKLANFYQSMRISFDAPTHRVFKHLFWKFGLKPVLAGGKSSLLYFISPGYLKTNRFKKAMQETPDWIAPDDQLRRILNLRLEETIEQKLNEKTSSHYLRQVRTGIDHPLVSMGLEESFDNMRRMGLKKSPPFLDHELVDFLYRTPPELLNKGKRTKGLIRDMLVRRYPEFGFETLRKVVATNFYRKTLVNQGKKAWDYLGNGHSELERMGVIDKESLDLQVQDIVSHKELTQNAWIIWYTLTLEAWVRKSIQ